MATAHPLIVTGSNAHARRQVFQAMSLPQSIRPLPTGVHLDGTRPDAACAVGLLHSPDAAPMPLYSLPLPPLQPVQRVLPQSLGLIAVITSHQPDAAASDHLPALEELSLQHGKPLVVVATDSDHPRAASPEALRHELGLTSLTPVIAWRSSEAPDRVQSMVGALRMHQPLYAQRRDLVHTTLQTLRTAHGDAIQWAVIASREGLILGATGLDPQRQQLAGGLSTAMINVYDHVLATLALGANEETLILGSDGILLLIPMGEYVLVIQTTSLMAPIGLLRLTLQDLIPPFRTMPLTVLSLTMGATV